MNTTKDNLFFLSLASNIRTLELKSFQQIPGAGGTGFKAYTSTITFNFSLQNTEPFSALATFLNNEYVKNSGGEIYYSSRGDDGTLHSVQIGNPHDLINMSLIELVSMCQHVFDSVDFLAKTLTVSAFSL